jgi:hypothetical protein
VCEQFPPQKGEGLPSARLSLCPFFPSGNFFQRFLGAQPSGQTKCVCHSLLVRISVLSCYIYSFMKVYMLQTFAVFNLGIKILPSATDSLLSSSRPRIIYIVMAWIAASVVHGSWKRCCIFQTRFEKSMMALTSFSIHASSALIAFLAVSCGFVIKYVLHSDIQCPDTHRPYIVERRNSPTYPQTWTPIHNHRRRILVSGFFPNPSF